ncbi:MAG: lipoyl(octanoyl) transferase LipB [Vicingaceae bacterium]
MPKFNLFYLNQTDYEDALAFQECLFNIQLERIKKGEDTTDYLIFLQHTPVYTLGKSGDESNLKVPIEETDAQFYKTNRGGDITYHGPGQLTGYPIFNLTHFGIGVREYVELMEQCVIDCIASYGLKGDRLEGASGVWLDVKEKKPRKICAIGIKVSRGVSMHGFAFNINTNLSYFENIIPCGIDDKGVTSLENELSKKMDFKAVEQKLLECFRERFKYAL